MLIKICENCGKEFKTIPSRIGRFCQYSCASHFMRGKNHHGYKERVIRHSIKCACGCGQLIENPRVYTNQRKQVVTQRFIRGHENSRIYKVMEFFTKDLAIKMYVNKKYSAGIIAKKFNCHSPLIIKILKRYGIKTRTYEESRKIYLKSDIFKENCKKLTEFMMSNNPMNNPLIRKKVGRSGKNSKNWRQKKVICPKCGKTRVLKPSRIKKLRLNGLCWVCYKHSKEKSTLEIKMGEELKRRGIEFKEQVSFKGMFLDFLLPNKIVIETDGAYWHSLPENTKRDRRKEKLLAQEGYKLYRFTDKEILSSVSECVDKINITS